MGADVTVLDRSMDKLRHFDDLYQGRLKTRYSDAAALAELVADADLVIGAVLLPGKKTPKLITRQMLASMRPGSVLVDVSIDQGGCAETSRPTSHSQPTYIEEGVVHYCVTNMPAACARTATQALASVVLPYALRLANQGMASLVRRQRVSERAQSLSRHDHAAGGGGGSGPGLYPSGNDFIIRRKPAATAAIAITPTTHCQQAVSLYSHTQRAQKSVASACRTWLKAPARRWIMADLLPLNE